MDTTTGRAKLPGGVSNINRVQRYDMEEHFIPITDLSEYKEYIYPNLYPSVVTYQPWTQTATEVLSYLFGKELDDNFVTSCYSVVADNNNVYNILIFLQYNGTILKTCWDNLSTASCSRINVSCPNAEVYKLDYIRNISPILTKDGLKDSEGELVDWVRCVNTIKVHIMSSPLISNFIVCESLLDPSHWNKDNIYIGSSDSPVVGYRNALMVGWGISDDGIPYWVMKNNWGEVINYDDIPTGCWKHAMYPYNQLSCVDISIQGVLLKNTIKNVGDRDILGGLISLSLKDNPRVDPLNINKFIPVSVVKNRQKQNILVYIISLLFFICAFYFFFRCN